MLCLALSACDLRPLYMAEGDKQNPSDQLAEIKIKVIPDREGQILRNHLLDCLNRSGEPTLPQAHLETRLTHNKVSISLRRDGTTQRFNVASVAEIKLWDKTGKKTLYTDTIKHTTSFLVGDRTAAYGYASVMSERDAVERGLKLLADDIQLALATYYQKWGGEALSDAPL
jgi:LPS-assembly lipoprotein